MKDPIIIGEVMSDQERLDDLDVDQLEDDELETLIKLGGPRGAEAQKESDARDERAYDRQQERAIEDGYDCYTGDMRLRDAQAEARKFK